MQAHTATRKYIRHPTAMPIQVSAWTENDCPEYADDTLTNVSLGGLCFISQKPLELQQRLRVCIPVLNQENFLLGIVVWCEKSESGYEVGLELESSKEVFRLRMIEQICHIEHYRHEVACVEGRELSPQEAASEWISKFAGEFPDLCNS